MSLNIGILVLAVGRDAGGPETYERELLRSLAAVDPVNNYTVYCTSEKARQSIGISQANFRLQVLRPVSRLLSLTVALPWHLRRDRIDLLHATFAPPPSLPARLVFTSHGLVNFKFPAMLPARTRIRLNALHSIGLRRANKIICVSQHTYQELCQDKQVETSRLRLIRHGIDHRFRPRNKEEAARDVEQAWSFAGPYALFVGKLQQVKNIERLLTAFQQFRRQHCPSIKLVLAGRVVESMPMLHRADLVENVIQLGYVDIERLPALYQAAEMLVFPSLFESFGLPALEAMRCGLPVIASRAGALPEVCGDAARLVDPFDTADISAAMSDVFQSNTLRACMRQQGMARAQDFSWTSAATATLDVYADVCAHPPLQTTGAVSG